MAEFLRPRIHEGIQGSVGKSDPVSSCLIIRPLHSNLSKIHRQVCTCLLTKSASHKPPPCFKCSITFQLAGDKLLDSRTRPSADNARQKTTLCCHSASHLPSSPKHADQFPLSFLSFPLDCHSHPACMTTI
eukprot:768261-Hanusia_phi.AAC.4